MNGERLEYGYDGVCSTLEIYLLTVQLFILGNCNMKGKLDPMLITENWTLYWTLHISKTMMLY